MGGGCRIASRSYDGLLRHCIHLTSSSLVSGSSSLVSIHLILARLHLILAHLAHLAHLLILAHLAHPRSLCRHSSLARSSPPHPRSSPPHPRSSPSSSLISLILTAFGDSSSFVATSSSSPSPICRQNRPVRSHATRRCCSRPTQMTTVTWQMAAPFFSPRRLRTKPPSSAPETKAWPGWPPLTPQRGGGSSHERDKEQAYGGPARAEPGRPRRALQAQARDEEPTQATPQPAQLDRTPPQPIQPRWNEPPARPQ